MESITFNLSGGIRHKDNLIKYIEEKGLENIVVFGSIYGLLWNGGRAIPQDQLTPKDFIEIVREYNEKGIGFNFTFSNKYINHEDLDDDKCNMILSECHNELNGVMIASVPLLKYITKEYPLLKRNLSACANMDSYEAYYSANNIMDTVVMSPDYNTDFKFLSRFDNLDGFEFIVNENCLHKCKFRNEHYDKVAKSAYTIGKGGQYSLSTPCLAFFNDLKGPGNKLTNAQLLKLYNLGARKFKFIGRLFQWDDYKKDLDIYIDLLVSTNKK